MLESLSCNSLHISLTESDSALKSQLISWENSKSCSGFTLDHERDYFWEESAAGRVMKIQLQIKIKKNSRPQHDNPCHNLNDTQRLL